jgi:hypothetical protein
VYGLIFNEDIGRKEKKNKYREKRTLFSPLNVPWRHAGSMVSVKADGTYLSRKKKTYNGKMIISFAKVLLSPYPKLTGPLPKEAEPDKHQASSRRSCRSA